MPKKQKSQPKSKQQIAAEIAAQQETVRLRKFSKDKFYPLCLNKTESIAKLRQFLQVFEMAVMNKFNEGMRKTTVGSLELEKQIKTTAPDKDQELYRDAFEMFKDENLVTFKRVVGDLQQVLGGLVQEWERENPLSILRSPFYDEPKNEV